MKFLRIILLVISTLLWVDSIALAKKIAFIGDSITAGAVVQPEIKFEAESLWQVFMGQTSVDGALEYSGRPEEVRLSRPELLPSGVREYEGAAVWLPKEILRMSAWRFLNRPDYSWANMLATEWGYQPENILFSAENGASSKNGVSQMARILKSQDLLVPEDLFIFFTGNDICSPMLQMMTSPEDFERNIYDTINYALLHGKYRPDTKYAIYLMPFLQISQLYSDTLLNEKKVRAHGKVLTCGELLKSEPDPWQISSQDPEQIAKSNVIFNFLPFPKNQGAYCPSLFGRAIDAPRSDPQQHRSMIANRIRSYRSALSRIQKKVTKSLEKRAELDLTIYVLDTPADIIFQTEHFAEDCFHLSAGGQWQVAKQVASEIESQRNELK